MPKTSARAEDRTAEEATSFALANRSRIEILAALNECDYSQSELARLLSLSESTVQYHLKELVDSGSIEIAETRPSRNFLQKIYRAKKRVLYGVDEMDRWTHTERQEFYSLILQRSGVEAMASLYGGQISEESLSWLTFSWINVDHQGWRDAFAVISATYERLRQVEVEAKARQEKSGGGLLRTMNCSIQAYPRTRNIRSLPH